MVLRLLSEWRGRALTLLKNVWLLLPRKTSLTYPNWLIMLLRKNWWLWRITPVAHMLLWPLVGMVVGTLSGMTDNMKRNNCWRKLFIAWNSKGIHTCKKYKKLMLLLLEYVMLYAPPQSPWLSCPLGNSFYEGATKKDKSLASTWATLTYT